MRTVYKALSLFWLWRAASKGPASLMRYLVRREIRRLVGRWQRQWFRRAGLEESEGRNGRLYLPYMWRSAGPIL